MILDMDTELQNLISISMEKMTSGANSSMAGRGNKSCGKMDLRKALLVARFLQEVRQAYCEENYEIVAKTFAQLENTDYYDKNFLCDGFGLIEEANKKYVKEPRNYFLDVDFSSLPTSSSAFPSCVTNTDVMVSRISQLTRPLSVSVNTEYVVCSQSVPDTVSINETDDNSSDSDPLVFCDELEVSSCCEVTSDDEVLLNPEENSRDHVTLENRTSDCAKHEQSIEVANHYTNTDTDSDELVSCPLPKKKRPLPKEFLSDIGPVLKTTKTSSNVNIHSSRNFDGFDITNTIATSISTNLTMKTKTSTFSAVCSVANSNSVVTNRKDKFQPSPKVVVQLTQSCNSYLPITCSQLYLEKRLCGLTAKSF